MHNGVQNAHVETILTLSPRSLTPDHRLLSPDSSRLLPKKYKPLTPLYGTRATTISIAVKNGTVENVDKGEALYFMCN